MIIVMNKRKKKTGFKLDSEFFKKVTFGIIGGTMVLVFIFAVYKLVNTPEKVVTGRIQSLTREYYEDYLYPKIKSSTPENKFEEVMRKYAESGVDNSHLSLRNILLSGGTKNVKLAQEIGEYCNLDDTIIEIFPQKPYGKSDYKVNYNYSCKF